VSRRSLLIQDFPFIARAAILPVRAATAPSWRPRHNAANHPRSGSRSKTPVAGTGDGPPPPGARATVRWPPTASDCGRVRLNALRLV